MKTHGVLNPNVLQVYIYFKLIHVTHILVASQRSDSEFLLSLGRVNLHYLLLFGSPMENEGNFLSVQGFGIQFALCLHLLGSGSAAP